jgi:hypothetical protein
VGPLIGCRQDRTQSMRKFHIKGDVMTEKMYADLLAVEGVRTPRPPTVAYEATSVTVLAKAEATVIHVDNGGLLAERYVFKASTVISHDAATLAFVDLMRRAAVESAEAAARRAAETFIEEVSRTGADPLDPPRFPTPVAAAQAA